MVGLAACGHECVAAGLTCTPLCGLSAGCRSQDGLHPLHHAHLRYVWAGWIVALLVATWHWLAAVAAAAAGHIDSQPQCCARQAHAPQRAEPSRCPTPGTPWTPHFPAHPPQPVAPWHHPCPFAAACAAAGDAEQAFQLYSQMKADGVAADKMVYSAVVKACAEQIDRLPPSDRCVAVLCMLRVQCMLWRQKCRGAMRAWLLVSHCSEFFMLLEPSPQPARTAHYATSGRVSCRGSSCLLPRLPSRPAGASSWSCWSALSP